MPQRTTKILTVQQLRAFNKEAASLALGCVASEEMGEGTAATIVESLVRLADQLGQPNRDDRAVVDLMDDCARKIGGRIEVKPNGLVRIYRDWYKRG